MKIRIARSRREGRTAYIAVHSSSVAGFAAIRCDLRSLLRYAGITLAALAAMKRLLRA